MAFPAEPPTSIMVELRPDAATGRFEFDIPIEHMRHAHELILRKMKIEMTGPTQLVIGGNAPPLDRVHSVIGFEFDEGLHTDTISSTNLDGYAIMTVPLSNNDGVATREYVHLQDSQFRVRIVDKFSRSGATHVVGRILGLVNNNTVTPEDGEYAFTPYTQIAGAPGGADPPGLILLWFDVI